MTAIETHRAEALPLGFSPKIDFLEDAMGKLPTVQLPVTHHFAKGVYRRECFVPQGTLVTSKIHKTQHFFVILKGDAYVWDETTGWGTLIWRVNSPTQSIDIFKVNLSSSTAC